MAILKFQFLTKLLALSGLISAVQSRTIVTHGGFFADDHEVHCSRIWNCLGAEIHVEQNGNHSNLGVHNFVPYWIQMRTGCHLTVTDEGGFLLTEANVDNNGLPLTGPIQTACCECFGCFGVVIPSYSTACAVVYEHGYCKACQGAKFEVQNGEIVFEINQFWNDKISSINVKPGCELKAYRDPYFIGEPLIVREPLQRLSPDWNDKISSYQCSCPRYFTVEPLPSTTRPISTALPITIPTIKTTLTSTLPTTTSMTTKLTTTTSPTTTSTTTSPTTTSSPTTSPTTISTTTTSPTTTSGTTMPPSTTESTTTPKVYPEY